jgi:site-specific DNA-cytosine methylase
MQQPNSPSATSSVFSTTKSFQKAALPSFDKLIFSHDAAPDGFRAWATKLAALVEGNFPEGRILHNFIDTKVGRSKLQTASQFSTVPTILMGEGFSQEDPRRLNPDGSIPPRASPTSLHASSATNPDDLNPEGDGEVHIREDRGEALFHDAEEEEDYSLIERNYASAHMFPPSTQRLNKLLYVTLQSIYKGSGGTTLNLPPHLATYTSAMIYLWDADKQNIAGRKINAVQALRQQQYQGDAMKWKLSVLNDIREVIETGYNINDMIYQCLFDMLKNQDGECLSILTKQLNELNSGPDPSGFQNWETNLSPIIQHLLTNKAVTGGTAPVQAIKNAPKKNPSRPSPTGPPEGFPPWETTPPHPGCENTVCGNCGQRGHHRRINCPAKALDTGVLCTYCGVKGHKAEVCNKKKADEQAGRPAPTNSVNDAARRADLMSQLAALEAKADAVKYVVADPEHEPPSSDLNDDSAIASILDPAPQPPQQVSLSTAEEIYTQVFAQEGLTDSEEDERIDTYATQEYLNYLDDLRSHMGVAQRLDNISGGASAESDVDGRARDDAEGKNLSQGKLPQPTAFSVSGPETLQDLSGEEKTANMPPKEGVHDAGHPGGPVMGYLTAEQFLKSPLSAPPKRTPTPPPAPVGLFPPARIISEAHQASIATTVAAQEGSAKIDLDPPDLKRATVDEDLVTPVYSVGTTVADKGTQKIIISLCDGIGGGATALVAAGVHDVTQYIGVENNETSRKIAAHANPKTDLFCGINHDWETDITKITEAHIKAFPAGSVVGLIAGTPCGDFSKNRLLPSTAPYVEARMKQAKNEGGKYVVTKFPRKGLNGKLGGLFRTAIQIWRWVKIHHPNATCFFENVVFNDMEDDWKEVNAALGEPIVINSMDYSTTARNRAYWTSHDGVKADPKKGMGDATPIDPNSCMNDDRQIGTYVAKGVTKVRPMGASWGGNPEHPQAQSNRKVWVHDPSHPGTPQDLHVTEAEKLHGMKADQTAAPGVSPLERIRGVGAGWDINIIKRLFGVIFKGSDAPQPLPAGHVKVLDSGPETFKLPTKLPKLHMDFLTEHLQHKDDPGYLDGVSTSTLAYLVALEKHPEAVAMCMAKLTNTSSPVNTVLKGSVIDSGAARHVCKAIEIEDATRSTRLCGFNGSHEWTEGKGYLPISTTTQGGHQVQMDIQDVDKFSNSATNLLSMGKLIMEEGWTIHVSKAESYAILPGGERVTLYFNEDKVLCLKHDTRSGREAMKIPSSAATLTGMIFTPHAGEHRPHHASTAPDQISSANPYGILSSTPEYDDQGFLIDDGQVW